MDHHKYNLFVNILEEKDEKKAAYDAAKEEYDGLVAEISEL